MKKILSLTLIYAFLFQSLAYADGHKEYQSRFFGTINSELEFDPVSILNSSKDEMKFHILSRYTSGEDENFLTLKLKEIGNLPKNFKASYKDKNILVEFLNKKMIFSNIDPVAKTFSLGETKIDLSKTMSLEDLYNVFMKIEKPFISSTVFNPSSFFVGEAQALGPFVLVFLAGALMSAATLKAIQVRKKLDELEDKIKNSEGICSALDSGRELNVNEAITKFEKTYRDVYKRVSSEEKNKVRKILSCSQLKESWWEWTKSWIYSIITWRSDDIRDRIIKICERAVKVDNCVKKYRNRGSVNNSSRDLSDPRYKVFDSDKSGTTSGSNRE